jgi:hypothetical protein
MWGFGIKIMSNLGYNNTVGKEDKLGHSWQSKEVTARVTQNVVIRSHGSKYN